jgi:prevent-host-death family protein
MDLNWQLADAKNRFSEVVRMALSDGPQRISRRDQAVVLMSEAEYLRLTGTKPSLIRYLAAAPESFQELDLARDQTPMRDADL